MALAEGSARMAVRELQNFIDGEYRSPVDGRMAPLLNPATGAEFAQAPVSSQADIDLAFQAARRAFESWREVIRRSGAAPF